MWAIVFKRDFKPGEHWSDHLPEPDSGEVRKPGKHRVAGDDSDRKQHWRKGDLYSTGTVVADPLPDHLQCVEITPPLEGQRWDRNLMRFVDPPHGSSDTH